ncbi:MAG: arsenate reductase (glutaredoxin) [Planctomycetes bacterium]|nr:arsenate reductase (glutaredoxin) [Planctomycetota bacterium]
MLTVYHNPRCSKSRATLALVEEAGVAHRVVEYLETPPTVKELDRLLDQLGLEPAQVTRTHEDAWAALGHDRAPPATRDAWLRALVEHPILLERPIVTDGRRAVIGRPPENVRALLGT